MVTYPGMRRPIAFAIEGLVDAAANSDPEAMVLAYAQAEEWLLVAFELDDAARDFVPSYFWNINEADAVAAVAQAIENIWEKHPNDAPDKMYWTDSDWPGVVELAKKAHALMVENDRKYANDGAASDT